MTKKRVPTDLNTFCCYIGPRTGKRCNRHCVVGEIACRQHKATIQVAFKKFEDDTDKLTVEFDAISHELAEVANEIKEQIEKCDQLLGRCDRLLENK